MSAFHFRDGLWLGFLTGLLIGMAAGVIISVHIILGSKP
jgi:thiamine transporter ThiT